MNRLAVLTVATIGGFLAGLSGGDLAFAGLCGVFGYFVGQTALSLERTIG